MQRQETRLHLSIWAHTLSTHQAQDQCERRYGALAWRHTCQSQRSLIGNVRMRWTPLQVDVGTWIPLFYMLLYVHLTTLYSDTRVGPDTRRCSDLPGHAVPVWDVVL